MERDNAVVIQMQLHSIQASLPWACQANMSRLNCKAKRLQYDRQGMRSVRIPLSLCVSCNLPDFKKRYIKILMFIADNMLLTSPAVPYLQGE